MRGVAASSSFLISLLIIMISVRENLFFIITAYSLKLSIKYSENP
jgi:hypothetical protein